VRCSALQCVAERCSALYLIAVRLIFRSTPCSSRTPAQIVCATKIWSPPSLAFLLRSLSDASTTLYCKTFKVLTCTETCVCAVTKWRIQDFYCETVLKKMLRNDLGGRSSGMLLGDYHNLRKVTHLYPHIPTLIHTQWTCICVFVYEYTYMRAYMYLCAYV
jgi:hypothetical protein